MAFSRIKCVTGELIKNKQMSYHKQVVCFSIHTKNKSNI